MRVEAKPWKQEDYPTKPVTTGYISDADKIKKLEKEIENIKRCLLVNGIVCGENDNDL